MDCPVCNSPNPSGASTCRVCGSALSQADSSDASSVLQPGTKLLTGKYSVGKVLGQGGFGITYRGADAMLKRPVAIKEFFPQGATRSGVTVKPSGAVTTVQFERDKDRFLDEARTLAQFRHQGIVQVYESFEENNTAYMVMELIKGKSIEDFINENSVIQEKQAIKWLREIGDALSVVHRASLLHRDIKPQNILISADDHAVLIDFGTAREFAEGKTSRMTQMLTPGYAPLEQYGQQMRFSESTDIYALCATAYHMLTGELPVQATDRAIGVELKPPHLKNAKISRKVSDVVMWGLAIKATERPQSIEQLFKALDSGETPPSNDSSKSPSNDNSQQTNPFEQQILTVLAELESNASIFLPQTSVHDQIQNLRQQIQKFESFSGRDLNSCPGCNSSLTRIEGKFEGICVICNKTKLMQRKVDAARCPVCRKSKLQRETFDRPRIFCPVCRVRPLRKDKRTRFGLPVDLWFVCKCGAEFDVLLGGRVKLVSFTSDPHGFGSANKDRIFTEDEWGHAAICVTGQTRCESCSALLFDFPDGTSLLSSARNDPYGVGTKYILQRLTALQWSQIAHQVGSQTGNVYCTTCRAEFDFDQTKRELTLLSVDEQSYAWIKPWLNKAVGIKEWCLMRAGKQSLSPGWLCNTCNTEFDDDIVMAWDANSNVMSSASAETTERRLVRTGSKTLSSHMQQSFSPDDWQRIGASVSTSRGVDELRTRLAELQETEERELQRLEYDQKARHRQLQDQHAELLKLSFLSGYLQAPQSDPRVRLKSDEKVFWHSGCARLKRRFQQQYHYWDRESTGMLIVTTTRLIYLTNESSQEWALSKVAMQREKLQSVDVLVLWIEKRKTPIGLQVLTTTIELTTTNNGSGKFDLNHDDLFDHVLKNVHFVSS